MLPTLWTDAFGSRKLTLLALFLLATSSACNWTNGPSMHLACTPTIANDSTPPGEKSAHGYYGNGSLWTALWSDGVVIADSSYVDSTGAIQMKWPWWRAPTVVGEFKIDGRRLDADAPPLRVKLPSGYGTSGFQASTLIFPTAGCWQVDARVGDAALEFVTLVRSP